MPSARHSIVVASNDDAVLERNLYASQAVASGAVPVHVERGAASASAAYNRGLEATQYPFVIFAHQDVYLPPDWMAQLDAAIEEVEKVDPNWAIIAPFGMAMDGRHLGTVWSTSLGRVVGDPTAAPQPVQSVDELVFVLNRASGLRFDESLPGFHMYGTDIVQAGWAQNSGTYVCHLPLVHNDKFHGRLGRDFGASYHYVRRKWRDRLPLRTPVVWVTGTGMALHLYRAKAWRSYRKRGDMALDVNVDPRVYSRQCGWEPAAPT